ncbi:MAG: hypothetical protein ACI4TZ_03910 [Christensenellales bacterium]
MENLKNFFVGSAPFEGPHLLVISLWAIATVLLILFTCLFAKTEKSKVLVIKITAGILLLATTLSRFVYYDFKPSFVNFLPSTFCSTMGFVLPLCVLFCKKDSKTLYFAVFSAFMGGLITMLSGDDIGQARVQNTLISYFYHGLMASLSMLCVAVKYSKPTLNKVPRVFVGLSIMIVYGVFTNQVFGFSNNMFLNKPLVDGTILTWWFVGILFVLVAILVAIVYEAITLKWHEQSLYKCYCTCANYIKSINIFKKHNKKQSKVLAQQEISTKLQKETQTTEQDEKLQQEVQKLEQEEN